MRKFLILAIWLPLLLIGKSDASPAKVAVFLSNIGNGTYQNDQVYVINTLNRLGIPYDVYDVGARAWGSAGVDDSVWFRQNYQAIFCPWMDGQSTGIPVYSTWGVFKNAAGTADIDNSPMSGRWGIPCFVQAPLGIVPATTYNDSAGNKYNCGILGAAPAGTIVKPSVGDAGTWRYRSLCKLRGNQTDTLFWNPKNFGCRPGGAGWQGVGSVAAIVWADTTFGVGAGGCSDGDTAVAIWRYRPHDNNPGIYYSVGEVGWGDQVGTMILLQYLCTQTSIRPARKIAIPIMQHDTESGALVTTAQATMQRIVDTLTVNKMACTYMTPVGSAEFPLFNATTLATTRAPLKNGLARWCPFSYQTVSSTPWNWKYYLSSDTTGARQRFQRMMLTGASTDSFGFASYSCRRLTPPAGISGAWLGGVFKDQGVEIVESLDQTPNAAGWTHQSSASTILSTINPSSIPADTRVMYVSPTIGFAEDSTLTVLGGNTANAEYIGSTWVKPVSEAFIGQASVYWHTVNVTYGGGDPFFAYLLGIANRQLKFCNAIVEWDTQYKLQKFVPRNSYTSRSGAQTGK